MTPEQPREYYSLLQLQQLLQDLVAACPMSRNVWITAELSDVRESGPHCYMELIQKDPSTGATVAKARATIWGNVWRTEKMRFLRETGSQFASGLKVMVQVSAAYHPLYGMNLNITRINTSFTLGERERKRREILLRLKAEGILEMNKEQELPRPCLRIAIISSAGAAGYGDFMNQLLSNGRRIKFRPGLFQAVMQGAQVSDSVIAALEQIAAEQDQWDCVCIIRGGGASTDLDGFDDYRLAANVAQFPLPVIVGIGHERDTTVLDYIAAERVKTPTAAAELLVGLACAELDNLRTIGADLLQSASDILSGSRQQLAYISGQLPTAPLRAVQSAERRLDSAAHNLNRIAENGLAPLRGRLDRLGDALVSLTGNRLTLAAQKLNASESLLKALSPQAVLARGFSITRVDGHAITSADEVPSGTVITTQLANGTITSVKQ